MRSMKDNQTGKVVGQTANEVELASHMIAELSSGIGMVGKEDREQHPNVTDTDTINSHRFGEGLIYLSFVLTAIYRQLCALLAL